MQALIRVNFDPMQEIGPKLGGGHVTFNLEPPKIPRNYGNTQYNSLMVTPQCTDISIVSQARLAIHTARAILVLLTSSLFPVGAKIK